MVDIIYQMIAQNVARVAIRCWALGFVLVAIIPMLYYTKKLTVF